MAGMQDLVAEGVAALQRGDTAAAQRAADQYRQRAASLERSKANIAKDAAGYGPGGTVLEGIGGGLLNVGRRTAGLLLPRSMENDVGKALGLTDESGDLQQSIENQSRLDERGSGKFQGGKFLGEMVATAPAGGLAGGLIKGGGLMAGIGRGALEGAVSGAQTQGAEGAGVGGILGAGMNPALRLLGKAGRAVVAGAKRTDAADLLIKLGAKLDLGQMNPEGIANRLIQASESAPGGLGHGLAARRTANLEPVIPTLAARIARSAPKKGDNLQRGVSRAMQKINEVFGMVDRTPLSPAQKAAVQAGRREAAEAGRQSYRGELQQGVDQADRLRMGRDAADNARLGAEASVIERQEALRLKRARNKPAPVIKAADMRVQQAKAAEKLAQDAQAHADLKLTEFVSPEARAARKKVAREGAQKVMREWDTPLLRDVQSDLTRHIKAEALDPTSASVKDVASRLAVLNKKDVSPAAMKAVAGDLKKMASDFRYGRSGQARDFRTAKLYERAAQSLETRIKEALAAAGEDVTAYSRANSRYGRLKILEKVAADAEPSGVKAPSGEQLLKDLNDTMTEAQVLKGKGGLLRRTGRALAEVQKGRAGPLQQSGITEAAVRLAQSTAGIPLASRPVSWIARGEHSLGRSLRQFEKSKRTKDIRMLGRTLLGLHAGAPGAVVSHEEGR